MLMSVTYLEWHVSRHIICLYVSVLFVLVIDCLVGCANSNFVDHKQKGLVLKYGVWS
jgi:hypothetical protein